MKKHCLLILSLLLSLAIFAQTPSSDDLLQQGLVLHDKGDYAGAIQKYDEILSRDPGFYLVYPEKCFSLFMAGKYDECVDLCKQALKKFPDSAENKYIYVHYGSALDALGKSEDALKCYSEGMRRYPDFYLLPFNKGVTEYRLQKYDEAVLDFERSATLNPTHASSHQFLAYSIYPRNKIAAAMALTTFLVLEPSGQRAEKNLKLLRGILGGNVQKKDDKNITISLSPEDVDTKEKGPDDFRQIELMISFSSAADLAKDSLNAMQKLENKLEFFTLAAPKKKGFFSNYYVTYLSGLKNNQFLETAAYVLYYSADDSVDRQWLDANKDKVAALGQWTTEHLGK